MERSLLSRQSEHRSSSIWHEDRETTELPLVVRRCDSMFWELYQRSSPRVVNLIDHIGFGGVARAGHILVDHALVTALVERWRPETHTFHLPPGECTITLQDVSILWGLRVDGRPITLPHGDMGKEDWIEICDRLLGFRPNINEIVGNKILKGPLERHLLLVHNEDDVEDIHIAHRARGLILLLMGGHLFSDHSGNKIGLRYLLLLEDVLTANKFSFGSAVLGFLYRSLCDASSGLAREICGAVTLVQLWAWERIPVLRPIVSGGPRALAGDLLPYGARWNVPFDIHRLPTHVLLCYRDQLDVLPSHGFVWLPYTEDVLQGLSPQYMEGADIWHSVAPLICWEIVEHHLPDRVLRQFGLEQFPPDDCDTERSLHRLGLRGHCGRDRTVVHRAHLQAWERRRESIVDAMLCADVDIPRPEYMTLYKRHTRLYIANPVHRGLFPDGMYAIGTSYAMLCRVVTQTMQLADGAMVEAAHPSLDVFRHIRDLCADVISSTGGVGGLPHVDIDDEAAIVDVQTPGVRHRQRIQSRGIRGVRRGGRQTALDPPIAPPHLDLVPPASDAPNASAHVPLEIGCSSGPTVEGGTQGEECLTQVNEESIHVFPPSRPRRVRKPVTRFAPS